MGAIQSRLDERLHPCVPFLFVSAMAEESSLSQQIRTVERSVVFLRQEHLTLLHGLHLEILSLQKRCSGEGDSNFCVPVDL